jgi:hypothetical protein
MDVLDSLNRLSFDIIGITAFEHDFNALPDMRYESIAYDWETKKALPTDGAVKTAGHGTPSEGGRIYEEYDEMFGPHDGRAGIRGMLHVLFPILDKWFVSTSESIVTSIRHLTSHPVHTAYGKLKMRPSRNEQHRRPHRPTHTRQTNATARTGKVGRRLDGGRRVRFRIGEQGVQGS